MKILLEICAASYNSAVEAMAGGADRIELCSALSVGGLTPSYATIKKVINDLTIPVHVLIRPREGNFTYSTREKEIILHDITCAKKSGAAGVVIGCLNEKNEIDTAFMQRVKDEAEDMICTFHRAFDLTEDKQKAIDILIRLKFDRILTSGGYATAWDGRFVLGELINYSNGLIEIMPGSGINEENIEQILKITGAGSIHSSAQMKFQPDSSKLFGDFQGTDQTLVKKMKEIVSRINT